MGEAEGVWLSANTAFVVPPSVELYRVAKGCLLCRCCVAKGSDHKAIQSSSTPHLTAVLQRAHSEGYDM